MTQGHSCGFVGQSRHCFYPPKIRILAVMIHDDDEDSGAASEDDVDAVAAEQEHERKEAPTPSEPRRTWTERMHRDPFHRFDLMFGVLNEDSDRLWTEWSSWGGVGATSKRRVFRVNNSKRQAAKQAKAEEAAADHAWGVDTDGCGNIMRTEMARLGRVHRMFDGAQHQNQGSVGLGAPSVASGMTTGSKRMRALLLPTLGTRLGTFSALADPTLTATAGNMHGQQTQSVLYSDSEDSDFAPLSDGFSDIERTHAWDGEDAASSHTEEWPRVVEVGMDSAQSHVSATSASVAAVGGSKSMTSNELLEQYRRRQTMTPKEASNILLRDMRRRGVEEGHTRMMLPLPAGTRPHDRHCHHHDHRSHATKRTRDTDDIVHIENMEESVAQEEDSNPRVRQWLWFYGCRDHNAQWRYCMRNLVGLNRTGAVMNCVNTAGIMRAMRRFSAAVKHKAALQRDRMMEAKKDDSEVLKSPADKPGGGGEGTQNIRHAAKRARIQSHNTKLEQKFLTLRVAGGIRTPTVPSAISAATASVRTSAVKTRSQTQMPERFNPFRFRRFIDVGTLSSGNTYLDKVAVSYVKGACAGPIQEMVRARIDRIWHWLLFFLNLSVAQRQICTALLAGCVHFIFASYWQTHSTTILRVANIREWNRTIIILAARRIGKTMSSSAFMAMLMMEVPHVEILCTALDVGQANNILKEVRARIKSVPWYKKWVQNWSVSYISLINPDNPLDVREIRALCAKRADVRTHMHATQHARAYTSTPTGTGRTHGRTGG